MSLATDLDRVRPSAWAVLAALRFAFAAGVFSQHIESYAPNGLTQIFRVLGGFPGVAGFLILSGFSIRASYESEPRGYLVRRVLRIFPVYVVAMLLAVLPYALFDTPVTRTDPVPSPTPGVWLGNLLMAAPFYPLWFPANGPLWTVQLEFFFYLLAPVLARRSSRTVWVILATSVVAYIAYPTLFPDRRAHLFNVGYGLTPVVYFWVWLLGWQLYPLRRRVLVIAGALVGTGALFLHWQGDGNFGFARLSAPLLAIAAIGGVSRLPELGRHIRTAMNWLGDISYEVYAFHVPLMTIIYTWTGSGATALYVVAVGIMSATVLHLVDRPLRRLGRKAPRGTESGAGSQP